MFELNEKINQSIRWIYLGLGFFLGLIIGINLS